MYHLLHEELQCSFFVFWSAAVNGTELFLLFFFFVLRGFFPWGCRVFTVEQWTGRNSLVCPWQEGEESGNTLRGLDMVQTPLKARDFCYLLLFLVAGS